MLLNKKICFLGAGSIAEAMIAGILAKQILPAENITVINQSNKERIYQLVSTYHVKTALNKVETINQADMLILAIKPKDVAEALLEIKPFIHSKQLIISVIAGVTTDFISDTLQHKGPVIRTMPNTSSMIGLSATAMSPGKNAKAEDVQTAQQIMEAIGTVNLMEENLLDAVTGLSGSGPAYIYYLVEAMEQAAVQLGMNKQTARELIVQTIIGAGHMLQQTNEDPAILREKVTSPGGSTMAGLETLRKFQFQEAMNQAIKQATARSKELGQQFVEITS